MRRIDRQKALARRVSPPAGNPTPDMTPMMHWFHRKLLRRLVYNNRSSTSHTRVMGHFKGVDINDLDACILVLKDEDKRQHFGIDFKKFAKQIDIIIPDVGAKPFLPDLKALGKINHGARNLYRDEQLDLAGVGEKVRALIEDHISATGVDPKIPPIDLLAADYKQKLQDYSRNQEQEDERYDQMKLGL